MSTPPAAGKRLTVRVDQHLSDDLAVLMRTGLSASDAVRTAVETMANIHRSAWEHGFPEGSGVAVDAATVQPVSYTGQQ